MKTLAFRLASFVLVVMLLAGILAVNAHGGGVASTGVKLLQMKALGGTSGTSGKIPLSSPERYAGMGPGIMNASIVPPPPSAARLR